MGLVDVLKEQRDEERWADREDPAEFSIQDTDGTPIAVGPKHSEMQGLTDDDHPQYFHKDKDDSDDIDEGSTNKFLTAAQKSALTGGSSTDADAQHTHDSKMDADIGSMTEKETPADSDVLVLESAGSLRKVTVENLRGNTHWEPVTNGDEASPGLVFCDGDIVMAEVTS